MNLSDSVTLPDHVVSREVDDQIVVLDLRKVNYFGLDPIGTQMWRLMADGHSLGEVARRITELYDVTRERAEHDVLRFSEQLVAERLFEIKED